MIGLLRAPLIGLACLVALAAGAGPAAAAGYPNRPVRWLIGFAAARVIYLMLIVLGIFESLSRIGGVPASIVAVTLADLLFDIGFGFVLVMSLINQPNRSSSY